jgi:hypothetical protein
MSSSSSSATRRGRGKRSARGIAGLCSLTVVAALFVVLSPVSASATSPAAFTTVNQSVDGTGHCQNGNPNINCNIYDGKQYVWENGGPLAAQMDDGKYFFTVLDPGGQQDPNDGTAANLSSPHDPYTDRTFTVTSGAISYNGPHDFANDKIRLMPYDDTSNPGGEYILAICFIGEDGLAYPVTPSDCKYDAFKVKEAPPGELDGLLSATKDAAPSFTRTYTWDVTKDVDQTEIHQSGTTATFNYTVTATRTTPSDSDTGFTLSGTIYVVNDPAAGTATDVTVSDSPSFDPDAGEVTDCTIYDPTLGAPTEYDNHAIMAPGTELDFPYSCEVTGATAASAGTNLATVGWTNSDNSVDSTVSPPVAFDFANATLNEVDACTTVTDPVADGAIPSDDVLPQDVCDTTTFKYSHEVTGTSGKCVTFDNTATSTTDDLGLIDTADKTVTLCVGADLRVSKTAVPTYTRTYGWAIDKSVDKTTVSQVGGQATFNYSVKVDQTSPTDSAIQAAGLITVTNPNDWEDITADVSDAVNNGGSCSVTGGGDNILVPAGQSVDVAYTCSYSAPLPADGTNTGTATWDAAAASTPNGTASGTAGVVFGAPTTTVNKTIHVTDSYAGALGTVTATDSAPFATKTFTYTRKINVPANACLSYDNTATITETGQTDSQTVRVCGAVTGGLTIGFWHNKNGQAIITGQAKTGVCPSATWLRQFAPFQDLSASATCAQVAAYDLTIFNAANAGGSSMNPMLKAQMLATAFNVYFSDPALGGNKIGASVALGGVKVDLTKVCKMIDASGGTATCSGTYQNVSAAFGGVTALTVSQMLTYAANQSNIGGSTWYGQVKATQGLAKDAFDAINNGVAVVAP